MADQKNQQQKEALRKVVIDVKKRIKPWMLALAAAILVVVLVLVMVLGGSDNDHPQATQAPVTTAEPTAEPTVEPTAELTAEPTETPTAEPTATPDLRPEKYQQAVEMMKGGDYQQAKALLEELGGYQDAKSMMVDCCANLAVKMLKQSDLKGAAALVFEQMDTIQRMMDGGQVVLETAEGINVLCFHVTLNEDNPTYDVQFVDAATKTRIAKAAFSATSGEMLSISTYYPEMFGFCAINDDFSWEETIQRLGLAEPTAEPAQ